MEDETPKRGPGRPPKQVVVAPREEVTYDVDAVIARRLSGSPFGSRDLVVPMREPGKWATYEANTLADRNMHYNMVHQLGWVPVTVADLQDGVTPDKIGWQVDAAGTLCRGPQGDQKLYKQPLEVWKQIQAAKARANMRGIGSAKAVKESMAEATAAQMGSEAADFVHGNITVTGSDRVTGGA